MTSKSTVQGSDIGRWVTLKTATGVALSGTVVGILQEPCVILRTSTGKVVLPLSTPKLLEEDK